MLFLSQRRSDIASHLHGNLCKAAPLEWKPSEKGKAENEPDSVTQPSSGNNKSRITIANGEENPARSIPCPLRM